MSFPYSHECTLMHESNDLSEREEDDLPWFEFDPGISVCAYLD